MTDLTFDRYPNQTSWGIRAHGRTIGYVHFGFDADADRYLPVLMAAEALRDAAQGVLDCWTGHVTPADVDTAYANLRAALDLAGRAVTA